MHFKKIIYREPMKLTIFPKLCRPQVHLSSRNMYSYFQKQRFNSRKHSNHVIFLKFQKAVSLLNLMDFCYQTQVQLFTTQKPILERQVLLGKERLLYSGGWQPGRRQTCVQKPTPEILLDHESFQKENHLGKGSESSLSSTLYRLLIGWW